MRILPDLHSWAITVPRFSRGTTSRSINPAWFSNTGVQYSRHNTWWEQGVDWQKYQPRCQYMLEQGEFQGEALFMTPETIPGQEGSTRPNLPQGYDFDLVSAKLVRNQLTVEDGKILAP